MSIPSSSKPTVPLFTRQDIKKINNKANKTKKKREWVDVDNDENGKRKPPMSNGVLNGRPHKRHKSSDHVTSTPSGATDTVIRNSVREGDLQDQRRLLPIAAGRRALIEEIKNNDVTVLLGETGSGKTTRTDLFISNRDTFDAFKYAEVPQYILESGLSGHGMIAVTQPRKVAATSLAARVAAEKDVSVGGLIGYAVRFDECSGPQTRIKYLTDGMIVRELLSDPDLSRYSVVIVDEAHERTLRTDLLIANLKEILKRRNQMSDAKGKGKANPLKIVVMSATLDAEKFSKYFNG